MLTWKQTRRNQWFISYSEWTLVLSQCHPPEYLWSYEPPHDKTQQNDLCAQRRLRSAWRVFEVRMKKHWVLSYPLSALRRLWSDWANAQADLSLRCAHMPYCLFCHEAAQLSRMCLVLFRRVESFCLNRGCTNTVNTKEKLTAQKSVSPVLIVCIFHIISA